MQIHSSDGNGRAADAHKTPELTRAEIEAAVQAIAGRDDDVQEVHRLSPLQEGVLYRHMLSTDGGAGILSVVLELDSRSNLDAWLDSLQRAVDRHEALRTAFAWEGLRSPAQLVARQVSIAVEELPPQSDPLDTLMDGVRKTSHWTLTRAPLLRLQVTTDTHQRLWYVLLQVHRCACDHDSLDVLLTEIASGMHCAAYAAPPSATNRDYAAWAAVQARSCDASAFFSAMLHDVEQPSAPYGIVEAALEPGRASARCVLPAILHQQLLAETQRRGLGEATLIHAAWALLVAHTSGQEDVVFGTAVRTGRHACASSRLMVGLSVNMLPLRAKLHDVCAEDLVEQIDNDLVGLSRHAHAPLHLAQTTCGMRTPVQLLTAVLDCAIGKTSSPAATVPGMRIAWRSDPWADYPLALSVAERADGLLLTARCDARIDPDQVISCMQVALQSLLDALAAAHRAPALMLPVLSTTERHRVVESFNATDAPYPRNKLVHQVFEEQVARAPDAVAVIYRDQSLTYGDLNRRANQLARYLRAQGIGRGTYVPVLMQRSLQMLIAQLSVLKAGAVYVPLDPAVPPERQTFVIRDCAARLVLADGAPPPAVDAPGTRWIECLAAINAAAAESEENLDVLLDSGTPAYVMYTSGSTGVPKGVVAAHHSVNRTVINCRYADFHPDDCLAHHSNPAFDASTLEVWGALLNGARVVIVPQRVLLDAHAFARLLEQHRVTMLYMSVGLFNQYSQALTDVLPQLRYLMVGGDVMEPGAVRRVLLNSPPRELVNGYGPTECTTLATWYPVETVDPDATSIPIGRPIANTRVYILDSRRQPVPVGVVGELYIGGAGTACGYLNRPELTAERFLPDPFSSDPDARMYKTGDLGRWRADGVVEFFGRNDQQVKIRGFRIELGEIEAQLLRHPQVREAVVLARQDAPGEKRLAAYVTARGPVAPAVEELRAHVKAALPDYMVPSAVVVLDSMPLNSSGKLDRRALPPPGDDAYVRSRYECPQTQIELGLAELWREVLHVDRIGRQDHFFELGADSIAAMRLIARVADSFTVQLHVQAVLRHATLASMAQHVELLMHQRHAPLANDASELEAGVL